MKQKIFAIAMVVAVIFACGVSIVNSALYFIDLKEEANASAEEITNFDPMVYEDAYVEIKIESEPQKGNFGADGPGWYLPISCHNYAIASPLIFTFQNGTKVYCSSINTSFPYSRANIWIKIAQEHEEKPSTYKIFYTVYLGDMRIVDNIYTTGVYYSNK